MNAERNKTRRDRDRERAREIDSEKNLKQMQRGVS